MSKIGILLTNTGTPDAPTTKAVRRYLREFLSDRRVIQIPRIIWLPILYSLILTTRPKKSATLYQKIWKVEGSPLRVIMNNLAICLEKKMDSTPVEVGMNYGSPSIPAALKKFCTKQIDSLVVLPLFPQYSHTSTASSFDRVKTALAKCPNNPNIRYINDYHDHPAYIRALADSVKQQWQQSGIVHHLLISFHGIPERFVAQGDPYAAQCARTAQLLAEALQLKSNQWTLCYQSQFGYDKWLKPSTQALFNELPAKGIKDIDIICPGFAVDCLETLEEISVTGKALFTQAGGHSLRYINALNDSDKQLELLEELVRQ
jgi:ferrochelatase